ncbi:MAG: MlaD family protein [Methylotenera sp.]|uniref:MlaD family protein n=1 Tax=Methylotenera sp. TaxID=2051956 RepID=UPI0024889E00|nr:MlaD family protein [Methylotenera sp.]MDI1310497.1 MlaD family protein [Methylotenera sp.]
MLILGAMLIAGILWIASGGINQKNYDTYLAIADESVAGLSINALVKYNGVEVGRVSNISLDPVNPQRVRLLLAIMNGTMIKKDTLATLKTQGLTGIAYVELSGGATDSPLLVAIGGAPYPEIKMIPSLSTRLENLLSTVATKLDHLSGSFDGINSPENVKAFSSALTDISTVAHTIALRKDSIDTGIKHAASTFANADQASKKLDSLLLDVEKSVKAVQLMANDTANASREVGSAAKMVGNDAHEFISETTPEIRHLITELNDLSTSLRGLSEQTERNPAGFIAGPSPVPEGPGESSRKEQKP